MEHKDVFLIETIIDYCNKTASYLKDNSITEESFLDNPYFQDTCAFYCLQIGENANDLSEQFITTHKDIEWRKIIGLRHVIAHEYGSIDPDLLWGIVTKNIPELCNYCNKLIKK